MAKEAKAAQAKEEQEKRELEATAKQIAELDSRGQKLHDRKINIGEKYYGDNKDNMYANVDKATGDEFLKAKTARDSLNVIEGNPDSTAEERIKASKAYIEEAEKYYGAVGKALDHAEDPNVRPRIVPQAQQRVEMAPTDHQGAPNSGLPNVAVFKGTEPQRKA